MCISGLHTNFKPNRLIGLIDGYYPASEATGSLEVRPEVIANVYFRPTYKISAESKVQKIPFSVSVSIVSSRAHFLLAAFFKFAAKKGCCQKGSCQKGMLPKRDAAK